MDCSQLRTVRQSRPSKSGERPARAGWNLSPERGGTMKNATMTVKATGFQVVARAVAVAAAIAGAIGCANTSTIASTCADACANARDMPRACAEVRTIADARTRACADAHAAVLARARACDEARGAADMLARANANANAIELICLGVDTCPDDLRRASSECTRWTDASSGVQMSPYSQVK